MDNFLRAQWDSTSIRHSFIRKVKASCQTVLTVFCFLLTINKTHFCILGRLWAGVPHSDSSASGDHFSRCRLYICVSVPVKRCCCSKRLPAEWSSALCTCAETQWGCLSSDILASTGHLCKWSKSSKLSCVRILNDLQLELVFFSSLVWCTLSFTAFLSAAKSHGRQTMPVNAKYYNHDII